jgi:translation elongation factor Ts
MQEGADRSGRRHGEGRGNPARQAGQQGQQGRDPRAAEGVVAIHIAADGKLGSIFEINSETDFVAKNDEFLKLAADCARLVAEKNPADVAALSALPMGGGTVESTRTALVGKIGENMSIRRFVRIAAKGKLASYIHGGSKIGVLVDVVGGDEQLAKDLAMHIAARSRSRWIRRACRPNCWTWSVASRSRRRAKPASRKRCWKRSPKARCRST